MKRFIAWLTLGLGASSCADITLPERGTCGNNVLEADEDCDGHADGRLGENLACRSCAYSCDGADCPRGWHCDAKQQCHHAIGELEPAPGSPFDLASNHIVTGDVDGDGNTDVAAFVGDGTVVRFGAGDGSLDAVATIRLPPSSVGSIGAADVSGDGRLDAVIPTRFGLGVLVGREDRTMESVGYSPYPIPIGWDGAWLIPVRVVGVAPEQRLAILRRDPDAKVKLGFVGVPGEPPVVGDSEVAGLEGRSTELLGTRIPVVNLDSDPAGTDELVLAFAGEPRIQVCQIVESRIWGCAGPWCPFLDCRTLELPAGYGVLRRDGEPGADATARAADIDGDGDLDLMVHAESNGAEGVLVALGNGTIDFGQLAVDSRFGARWPLVAADLNGDRAADYVMQDGVHFASGLGQPLEPASAAPGTEQWIEAVAGDFDRDTDQDVFLSKLLADGSPWIELRRGRLGEPAFPRGPEWPLSAGAQRAELLRVADFDDDGIDDLAFVDRGPTGDGDALRVLWGSRDGAPRGAEGENAPDRVARFQRIDHLEVGLLRARTGDFDGASELVVNVSERAPGAPEPEPGVGAFGGSPLLRRLLSPFVLAVSGEPPDRAESAFAGDFIDDDVVPKDLLVFTTKASDGGQRTWSIPGAEDARFAALGTTSSAAQRPATFDSFEPPADSPFDPACASFAVRDIDGDGLDELVGVDCENADRPSTLLIAGAAHGTVETCFVQLPDFRGAHDIALGDFDGDGRSELVVADDAGVAMLQSVARFCETSGEPPVRVDLPARGAIPKSLTILDVDADTTPELAVLDEEGVYFVEIDASGGRGSGASPLELGAATERIRSADFNSDGLDDLLWSNGLQAGVLLAKSHRGDDPP